MLPNEDALRWLIARYAHIRANYGEFLDNPALVEPTVECFPDPFASDTPGVRRLFRRILSYTPVADDVPFHLEFLEPEGDGHGCKSGACKSGTPRRHATAPEEREDGSYVITIPVGDVSNPVLLTTTLSRMAGGLVVLEAQDDEISKRELGSFCELVAAASGLGVLLFAGSCVYLKGCGGLQHHRATHLAVEELAVAVALFARLHGAKLASVRKHLEATQSEAFNDALAWVDSNEAIVKKLREAPELLVGGAFTIEPVRGLLGRMFGKSAEPTELAPAPKQRSESERKRIEEAKALVEEALREP